ncbi:NCS2 family permease [Methanosarcina sp.]|uniref:NCS2 family permease n=1 Tax=Methanosarcina sp. TaxID=2213 RepID=UPI003C71E179
MEILEKLFKLRQNKTDPKTEALAGLTTFVTMAYIIFVNPTILSSTGMDFGAVMVATCLSAAIGTLIMGLWANYPFALAPGMGLNAFFAFTVVLGMNISWQAALTAVLIDGIIFVLLTLTKFRETVVNEIPKNLKIAISAGIGFFIAFIGFTGSKIIVQDPNTFVTLGNLRETTVLLSILGFTLMIVLQAYRVRGAILWGIIAVTVLGMVLGITEFPDRFFSMPPSLAPIAFKFDFSLLANPDFYVIMFTFLFTDFFDTVGTLVGVSSRADFLDEEGRLPRAKQALMADAIATCAGAVMGTSTVTTYVESASGVEEGGRTGLTSVVVAGLFLLAVFISPIAAVIPGYATSPALIMVGIFMIQSLRDLDFETWTEVVPATVTILVMTFSYSIAEGIVWGIISYTAIKVGSGKLKDISLIMVFLSLVFLLKEIYL